MQQASKWASIGNRYSPSHHLCLHNETITNTDSLWWFHFSCCTVSYISHQSGVQTIISPLLHRHMIDLSHIDVSLIDGWGAPPIHRRVSFPWFCVGVSCTLLCSTRLWDYFNSLVVSSQISSFVSLLPGQVNTKIAVCMRVFTFAYQEALDVKYLWTDTKYWLLWCLRTFFFPVS